MDTHIRAFASRVAFCCKQSREAFSQDELYFIEAAYYANEQPVDVAYDIMRARCSVVLGANVISED